MEHVLTYLEFRIDTDKKLLYGKWLRDVNNEEYKAGLEQIYTLIKSNDILRWVQNSELLQPRDLTDQKWLAEEYGLLLTLSSIKYIAVIVPRQSPHYNILMSLREKAYRIFGKSKYVELFETEQEALAWLIPNMQFYRLPSTTLSF
ncbi:hypothetical protein JAO76_09030 [Pontibacter sp. BT310]|uniref:STAS/SEC14 domain-containing protein n=1 Tax=Pontibacter populi TaxID=890055 RepID=A0ABS6XBE3_9BACT|nr:MULTISPECIES: hypothetical protein [Pontibacter]MBJ6118333.1 hypothetical protein [Pontibacter sp. BT310]MBR0570760.1 hypothetical protein [Microvirga sp. STS03]MBW3365186.1 hypothetical protein [Pontibacter populi]